MEEFKKYYKFKQMRKFMDDFLDMVNSDDKSVEIQVSKLITLHRKYGYSVPIMYAQQVLSEEELSLL